MKELIQLIEKLLANPSDFQTNRQAIELELHRILDRYADDRPPSIEHMIELLKEDFPSMEKNYALLQKADALRNEMIKSVFSPDFEPEEVKKYEARIALFERVVNYNLLVNDLLQNVAGTASGIKKSRKGSKLTTRIEDTQGAAQKYLTKKERETDGQE